MKIREAAVEDASELATVHVLSWRSAYQGVLPEAYLDSLDPVARRPRWEEYIRDNDWPAKGVLVAEDSERLIGFAYICPSRDGELASAGEVGSIYVLPEAWGKGFGRRLMDAALTSLRAADFDEAILWVLDSNVRAIRFYEAGGWHDDRMRKAGRIGGRSITEARYRRGLQELPRI